MAGSSPRLRRDWTHSLQQRSLPLQRPTAIGKAQGDARPSRHQTTTSEPRSREWRGKRREDIDERARYATLDFSSLWMFSSVLGICRKRPKAARRHWTSSVKNSTYAESGQQPRRAARGDKSPSMMQSAYARSGQDRPRTQVAIRKEVGIRKKRKRKVIPQDLLTC